MKPIIKYQASDGSEWLTEEKAMDREAMIEAVDKIMAPLKPTPTECNWAGYVQQDEEALAACKAALYRIANTPDVLGLWIDSQKTRHGKTDSDLIECHPSWFCRMLDGGHAPLNSAYSRLCRIDDQYREWNQPYFANHPDKGEQVCAG